MSAISKTVTIGNGTKNDFQWKPVLPVPEAVVTFTAKESLCYTERGSLQVLTDL